VTKQRSTLDTLKNPGPEPERLRIDSDDWEGAVRDALQKGKPPAPKKGSTKTGAKKKSRRGK
jgi:hypothetical protein